MRSLLLILALCWPHAVLAATSLHVEWGYTPPSAPAVTGFKLYQEGVAVCQTMDPGATAMDCLVSLTQGTIYFTMTAAFNDSTESPHSAPFAFTPTAATVRPALYFGQIGKHGGCRGWVGLQ